MATPDTCRNPPRCLMRDGMALVAELKGTIPPGSLVDADDEAAEDVHRLDKAARRGPTRKTPPGDETDETDDDTHA